MINRDKIGRLISSNFNDSEGINSNGRYKVHNKNQCVQCGREYYSPGTEYYIQLESLFSKKGPFCSEGCANEYVRQHPTLISDALARYDAKLRKKAEKKNMTEEEYLAYDSKKKKIIWTIIIGLVIAVIVIAVSSN